MAIKPADHILNLKTGKIPAYWNNFLKYVRKLANERYTYYTANKIRMTKDLYPIILKEELAKFNALLIVTKKYETLIKFKTPEDMTYFALKWI